MNSDFKDLLRLFAGHEVRYLVVGGYAVSHHAQPRFTKNLDLWIEPNSDNASRVSAALREFGIPLIEVTVSDFPRRASIRRRHATEPARFSNNRPRTPIYGLLAFESLCRYRRNFRPTRLQARPDHCQENRSPRPGLGRPRRTPTIRGGLMTLPQASQTIDATQGVWASRSHDLSLGTPSPSSARTHFARERGRPARFFLQGAWASRPHPIKTRFSTANPTTEPSNALGRASMVRSRLRGTVVWIGETPRHPNTYCAWPCTSRSSPGRRRKEG